jgi:hypothetical protein
MGFFFLEVKRYFDLMPGKLAVPESGLSSAGWFFRYHWRGASPTAAFSKLGGAGNPRRRDPRCEDNLFKFDHQSAAALERAFPTLSLCGSPWYP